MFADELDQEERRQRRLDREPDLEDGDTLAEEVIPSPELDAE